MATSFRLVNKAIVDGLNRFAGWLLFLAIVWLCWGIARIIWLVVAPPQAPQLPLLPLQTKQAPMVNTSTALTIFASNQPKPIEAQLPPPNVELVGIMLATPNTLSSAILMVDGKVANYRIGATLTPTAYKLIDVTWEQAVIEADSGQQILLRMPERMVLDQGGVKAQTPEGNISNRRLPSPNSSLPSPNSNLEGSAAFESPPGGLESQEPPPDATAPPANNNDTPPAAPTLDTAIASAVDALKQNPASYLGSMGVMATGNGYQVTDAMPAKLRKQLGLESGDRVLSVNGQTVGSNPAGDADLLNQVKQSGSAAIEVQRGEQVITIRQQF